VFVAPECGRFEILTLPLRALAHRLSDAPFKCFLAEEVTIELSRPRASVALDGEVSVMRPPFHFRMRPGALHLIVPVRPAS
jgi:diacylglycerol kinase family enzyme